MCGIYGEFLFDGFAIDLQESRRKLDLLIHRGPDGYGLEYGDYTTTEFTLHRSRDARELPPASSRRVNYVLGHRRLSIVDLNDNAFQPMVSSDGRCSVVFNGEIYNYVELRQELTRAGYVFQTDHSDTEVLLNAYRHWGHQCVGRFRGMFAFAVFDRRRRSVFIARDRIGKKPLYFTLDRNRFAFSSELTPLVSTAGTRWKINREALCCYVAFGYVPHPMSICAGVSKLPPASAAVIDLSKRTIQTEEYWDVCIQDDTGKTADQFLEEVDAVLEESVMIRLRADVPLGAFISGGTDSTLVVKKIHELSPNPCDIFGADFPQPEQSERPYIEQVARRYEQKLHLAMIDGKHAQGVQNVIDVFDEPFDGSSSIALFELFRMLRGDFKVILTGDGGDELFAGYPRYRDYRANRLPSRLLGLVGPLWKALASVVRKDAMSTMAEQWMLSAKGDFWTRYLSRHFRLDLADLVIGRNGYRPEQAEIFSAVRSKVRHPEASPIKSLQYLELKTILPCRMLYKLDRFSMRYGVEARSPFLDQQLTELAFSIPSRFSISKRSTKILLKRLLMQDFPASFVQRGKHGFGNPLSHWFSEPDAAWHFSLLNDERSHLFRYVDYRSLHARLPEIAHGFAGSREKTLWRFIVLAQFLEKNRHHIE